MTRVYKEVKDITLSMKIDDTTNDNINQLMEYYNFKNKSKFFRYLINREVREILNYGTYLKEEY